MSVFQLPKDESDVRANTVSLFGGKCKQTIPQLPLTRHIQIDRIFSCIQLERNVSNLSVALSRTANSVRLVKHLSPEFLVLLSQLTIDRQWKAVTIYYLRMQIKSVNAVKGHFAKHTLFTSNRTRIHLPNLNRNSIAPSNKNAAVWLHFWLDFLLLSSGFLLGLSLLSFNCTAFLITNYCTQLLVTVSA